MKNILHLHSTTSHQTIKDNVMYLKKYLLVAFMLLITIIAFSQEEPDVLIGNSNEPEQIIVNVEPVLKSVVSTECTDPDPINCDGVAIVNLDFDEDRMTRISGLGSIEVGDKFKFGQVAGVGSDIDAIVEIIELHQGYIEDIDVSSEGYDNALQPKFVSYGDFNGDEAWVDFKISFFYCNTSIPANISRFYGFGVDIDGGYYRNEFQQFNFTGTPDFGAGAAANIDIVNNPPGGYNIRFIDKTNTSADGIPINTWDRMVRMTFEGANSFNWRIGVKYNSQASSAYRLFSLYAKCIPGFAPAENDLGDAPHPYPTLNITLNGAKHVISPSIFLGSNIDAENDGQPSPNADGDDNNGTPDDEDGVFISGSFKNGETKTIVVNAHGTGKLNAWIDWNDDGDWSDAGEQIATDLVLADGNNNVNIDVPCTIGSGFTFARFRYSTNAGLTYEGPASDGEVEDYMVTLDNSNPTPNVEDPANQTKCAGENTNQVTFTGSVDGTIFNWTNNTPSIGLAASGTGNIASFVAINNGTTPVTATITVTPSKNGCVGNPQQFTITVNPNTVTLDPAGPFTTTSLPYQLTATPSGGTFSGTGVSSTGLFDPATAGDGNHVITYTVTNQYNCTNSDQITIVVTDQDCGACDGQIVQLTFKYYGPNATVKVKDSGGRTVYNQSTVQGQTFTINPYPNYVTLGPKITLYINGIFVNEIHTSCSQPIGPGMVFGYFEILEGYSKNGGLLCDFDIPGKEWQFDCGENVYVEVVGTGTNGNTTTTLTFPDLTDVDSIYVEAVFKGGSVAPTTMEFSSSTQTIIAPRNQVLNGGDIHGIYRAKFNPTSAITLKTSDSNDTHSFVAYVFKSNQNKKASVGSYEGVYLYKKTAIINLPITLVNKDIEIIVPISELNYDDRVVIITATAGGVTETKTISRPNLGSSLNIEPFTLSNVPGTATNISIEVKSPTQYEYPYPYGDSFIYGTVVANITCKELPQISCPPADSIQGCSTDDITDFAYSETEVDISESAFTNAGGIIINEGCGVNTITYKDSKTGTNPIIVTRTFTLYDDCGETTDCPQTIKIYDTTPPTIVCPSDKTVGANDKCEYTIEDYTGEATVHDNCTDDAQIIVTQNPTATTVIGLGTTTIWLYAEDELGNIDSCNFTVTVVDSIPPEITAYDTTIYVSETKDNCIAKMIKVRYTVSDNCTSNNNLVITQGPDVNEDVIIGDTTIMVIAEDESGNLDTAYATVHVLDTTDPHLNCPDDQTIKGCNGIDDIKDYNGDKWFEFSTSVKDISVGEYTSQSTVTTNDIWDNCTIDSVTYIDEITYDNNQDTIIVERTFEVTDKSGNKTWCTQTFTVVDEGPEAKCKDATVYVDSNGNASITVTDINNGSTDDCGIDTMWLNKYDFDCGDIPSAQVTLTVKDSTGNTDQCTATVTIKDTFPPEVTALDTTIYVDGNCIAKMVNIRYTATDNCTPSGSLIITQGPTENSDVNIGDTTVMVIAKDLSGNLDTTYATVHVLDTTNPHLNCPDDQTITSCGGTDDIENYNNDGWFKYSSTLKVITVGQYTSQSTVDITDIWDNCTIDSVTYKDEITYNNNQDTIIVERTFEVTDESGNKSWCIQTFTIVNNLDIEVTSKTDVACYGNSDGSITVSASDGTQPYQFKIDNGTLQSSGTFNNLAADTYMVYVVDGNNCEDSVQVTINQPTKAIKITLVSKDTINCFGDNTGSIDISVSGGIPATTGYIFNWSNSATTEDINNLTAGTYQVFVTDSLGCEDSLKVTIGQPVSPINIIKDTIIDVVCYGDSTGAINISVTGGTGSYTYLWSNGETTEDIDDLKYGSYKVVVTDANGCKDSASYIVSQNIELSITANKVNDATCDNAADGKFQVTIQTGVGAPYEYSKDGGATYQSSNIFDNLLPDTYYVMVKDANGCTDTASVIIGVTDNIDPIAKCKNKTIYLDSTGLATIVPSDVDGGSTDNCGIDSIWVSRDSFYCDDNSPEMIQLYVRDSAGNQDYCDAYIYIIDTLDPDVIADDTTYYLPDNRHQDCRMELGWIKFEASDNCSSESYLNGTKNQSPSYGYPLDLGKTKVTIEVNDENYNYGQDSAWVTVLDTSPPHIDCPSDVTLIGCSTDQISDEYFISYREWFAFSDSVIGISEYDFNDQTGVYNDIWDNCDIDSLNYVDTITYNQNDSIIVERIFTVWDNSGNKNWCTQTFTIKNTLDVSINNKTNILCYGDSTGSATATVSGGISPFEYKWFDGAMDSIGNTKTINTIPAGTYYFQVIDDNGCDAMDSVNINQADTSLYIVSLTSENTTCIGDSTGYAKIEVAGGTTPYKYEWKRGSTLFSSADSIYNQPPGTYDIIVTDSNGCSINDQVIIQQIDTIKPVITCGEDTVYLDNNGDYTIDITDINFTASDNCELIDTSYVPATFDCSELFNPNVSIYIEVEDASGNKNHCLSDITVLDTISPLINMGVCHADVELLRDANCEAVVPSYKLWTEVNTTDNCAVDSVLQIPAAGTVISNNTLVKLYAWDKSNNVDSCSFNITLRRAPDAVDDFEATNEDTPVDVIVLSNDTDCDNDLDSTSVKVISGPTNGSTTVNPVTGVIKYNPDLNFNGKDTFEYRVCDTTLPALCDTAVVIITVGGDNDPPVAVNDSVITPEDVAVVIDVLDNDYDVDGDPLQTVSTFSGPANGNVTILNNDSIRYTPDLNFNGKDTFQYIITDGNGGKDTAFVFVTITPVNDPPVAVNDSKTTNEDVPVVIDVQDNDSDPDGDPLTTISYINGPKNGTAVILNTDSIHYLPVPNFNGKDTFQYVISDGNGGKDTAFVYITITPVNDPPVAINDTVITNEDTPVVIDVQDNDYDIDGDPLKTTATLNGPSNGSVNILANDSIRYTPNLNFNGKDTFEYIITDNNGGFDTAFVFITISPVNDPPVAVDDYKSTNEDIPVVIDVQHNDSDPDGDPLTTTNKINGPKNGTAVILNADSIMYTPNPLFNGKDTFQYIISDGNGGKDTAFVYISIGSVNNPPVAINDTIHVSEDTTNVFIDVQVNDSDPDGDPLTTSLIWADTSAVGGTVSVVNGDSLKYTPPKHFYGLDSILYQICDNGTPSLCDSAYVFITVDSMYVRLLPKVMLHGALLGTNGLLMQDELRVKGFIPMTEPYTGLGYTHVAGGGGETVSDSATVFGVTGNNAIVDWVFVELRNPGDKTQVVATKSALVQRDGDVVDVDGVSPLIFDQTLTGSYYVSIRHRNHLGAMTATAIPLTSAGTVVDFTDMSKDFWNSTAAYDGKEQNSEYDKYALWAGTSNGDNYVRFAGSTNDTKPIFNAVSQAPNNTTGIQTFTYNGYHLEDINMDAKVRFSGGGNDVSILFNIVAHHPINTVGVQTFSFKAQLPN